LPRSESDELLNLDVKTNVLRKSRPTGKAEMRSEISGAVCIVDGKPSRDSLPNQEETRPLCRLIDYALFDSQSVTRLPLSIAHRLRGAIVGSRTTLYMVCARSGATNIT
jgi:hypothetical protein